MFGLSFPERLGKGGLPLSHVQHRCGDLSFTGSPIQHFHRFVHAFPSVENLASNAICRKAGFTLLEEADFEYPKGRWMRCYDWAFDLHDLT